MLADELMNDPFFAKFISRVARMLALDYQQRAPQMTADEIYEDSEFFPKFDLTKHNYLEKKAGYVCQSPRGNMVRLLQPYDSTVYTSDPEELPAQWGFYWSKDPKKATEFMKLSTSPYSKGDCCIENGEVYRSTADNNVWSPSEYATYWEKVPEEELM